MVTNIAEVQLLHYYASNFKVLTYSELTFGAGRLVQLSTTVNSSDSLQNGASRTKPTNDLCLHRTSLVGGGCLLEMK